MVEAVKNRNRPAPNSYLLPSTINSRMRSLGARLPTEIDLKAKNGVPGPDRYDLATTLLNP